MDKMTLLDANKPEKLQRAINEFVDLKSALPEMISTTVTSITEPIIEDEREARENAIQALADEIEGLKEGGGITLPENVIASPDSSVSKIVYTGVEEKPATLTITDEVDRHNDIEGRSEANCHPISAITGLNEALQEVDNKISAAIGQLFEGEY